MLENNPSYYYNMPTNNTFLQTSLTKAKNSSEKTLKKLLDVTVGGIEITGGTISVDNLPAVQDIQTAGLTNQVQVAINEGDIGGDIPVQSEQWPDALGQLDKSESVSVTLAVDQEEIDVISSQMPEDLGQKEMAESMSVTIADDQTSILINTPQLPSGTGQKSMANSMSVAMASNMSSILVDTPQLANSLGQKTMSASAGIVIASDQSTLPVSSLQIPVSLGKQDNTDSMSITLSSNEPRIEVWSEQMPLTIGEKFRFESMSVTLSKDEPAIATDITHMDGNQIKLGKGVSEDSLRVVVANDNDTLICSNLGINRGNPNIHSIQANAYRNNLMPGYTVVSAGVADGQHFHLPTSAVTSFDVVSSSGLDVYNVGIGAWTIEVFWEDADKVEQHTTVQLNGTTAVPITMITGFFRFVKARTTTTGTNNQNQGDVSIYETGTIANLYGMIGAGCNMNSQLTMYIPPDHTFYPKNLNANGFIDDDDLIIVRLKAKGADSLIWSRVYIWHWHNVGSYTMNWNFLADKFSAKSVTGDESYAHGLDIMGEVQKVIHGAGGGADIVVNLGGFYMYDGA